MGYLVDRLSKEFDEYMMKVANEPKYDPVEVSSERATRQVGIKKAGMTEENFFTIQAEVFAKFEAEAVIRNLNAEAALQKARNQIVQDRNDLKKLWAEKEAHNYDPDYEPKLEEVVDNTISIEEFK